MHYRHDLDGLRAFAVLLVLLCHAGVPGFSNGFVGVDVFFALSGFVISRRFLTDGGYGWAAIGAFYRRRALRILPALFVTLALALALGWVLLSPPAYADLAQSAGASLLFVANLHFMQSTGYFSPAADYTPLLHLWSLGVEEQFYLLFPLLFCFVRKLRSVRFFRFVIALFVICALVSAFHAGQTSEVAFYLSPCRFWELLAGVLASLVIDRYGPLPVRFAAIGLSLLVVGMPFDFLQPGAAVLGTVLVLLGGESGGPGARLLQWPPLRAIGKISFSLYLLHQPLFVAARLIAPEDSGRLALPLAFALTFILAAMMYRWVEVPCRWGVWRGRAVTGGQVAIAATLSGGLVFAAAALVFLQDGFTSRASVVLTGDLTSQYFYTAVTREFPVCQPATAAAAANVYDGMLRCVQSKPDVLPDTVILGDSHAEQYFFGLAQGLPDRNVAYYVQISKRPPEPSSELYKAFFAAMAQNPRLKTVLVANYWDSKFEAASDPADIERALRRTLSWLRDHGIRAFVVLDTPNFPAPAEACKYQLPLLGDRACHIARADLDARRAHYEPYLLRAAQAEGAGILQVSDLMCDDRTCRSTLGNTILLRDLHHLNTLGSRRIGGELAVRLQAAEMGYHNTAFTSD